jgi:hypothetical protein
MGWSYRLKKCLKYFSVTEVAAVVVTPEKVNVSSTLPIIVASFAGLTCMVEKPCR